MTHAYTFVTFQLTCSFKEVCAAYAVIRVFFSLAQYLPDHIQVHYLWKIIIIHLSLSELGYVLSEAGSASYMQFN